MKAKVVIEHGETAIVLTPENVFETDVLEKLYRNKERCTLYIQLLRPNTATVDIRITDLR